MQRKISFSTEDKKPESIKVYEDVLSGKIYRFPAGFFSSYGIIDYTNVCIPIIKYLIDEILKWNHEEVCKNITRKTFHDYALGGMLSHYFNDSPYAALDVAYPGEYKPWELAACPRNFWNKDNAILAVRWLYDKKLKWSLEQICSMTNVRLFKENGLDGMLRICFKDSPTLAILNAYPDEITIDKSTGLMRCSSEKKSL